MAPFVAALEAYHDQTEPNDWLEALIKAYVGDGIADDFYREVAALAGPARPGAGAGRRCTMTALRDFAAEEIRDAIAADPRWPTGCRCGPAGWSVRVCRRRSGSPRSDPALAALIVRLPERGRE